MRILVTGGAGFIGANFVHYLNKLSKDIEIIVIDDLSTGRAENLFGTTCAFVQFKVCQENKEEVESCVSQADVVLHLAATVGIGLVMHNPYECIMNNIQATETILEACKKYRKRCLIASTSEVYGKNNNELKEAGDVTYGTSYKSRWSYAASKYIDEFLTLDMYNKYRIPATILRFFNITGPGQVSDYGMVVPRFIDKALKNEPIPVFFDGSQKRTFTHIHNVCEIIFRLIGNSKSYGKVINIGSGQEMTILELANKVKEITKSESKIILNSEKLYYNDAFEDMPRRLVNIDTLKEVLGENNLQWFTIDDIINDILKWRGVTIG